MPKDVQEICTRLRFYEELVNFNISKKVLVIEKKIYVPVGTRKYTLRSILGGYYITTVELTDQKLKLKN